MKRGFLATILAAAAASIAAALVWSPWSPTSLEKSTAVLPVAAASAAPAAGRDDVMAIIYSGDGGWADLDRRLGIAFIDRGIPVLGVNTFKYYWRERTPAESTRELDALMTRYLGVWGKRRVWLVGFSFGADVLPSIIGKLRAENRARIAQLVLLSPSRDVTFEIELEGYMIRQGWFKEHLKTLLQRVNPVVHHAALPPLRALAGRPPVVCYYGLDESDDSVCTLPDVPAWLTVHPKKGDHHFDGGYQRLAKQMLDELPKAGAPDSLR